MDALVEALVAAAEQRDAGSVGELGRQASSSGRPAGGERDHAPALATSTRRRRNGPRAPLDDVDPDTMPAPPPYGVSSTCPALERRRRAQVDARELVAEPERVADVPLLEEPVEPAREQREDVDAHSAADGGGRGG